MSQQQPQRPQAEEEPFTYGDVFPVSGELEDKPILPKDAATMQAAENQVLGQTQKGGPAAMMQSAATQNERAGLFSKDDATDITGNQSVTVEETDILGNRVITESVGGQVVGQYMQPAPMQMRSPASAVDTDDPITIGEALEASAISAGDKPVDQSDAAAIQAAEARASRQNITAPGGIAATAQSAASMNARTMRDEDKIKLGDVLTDATARLPSDKAASREDAERVVGAELRNNINMATHPGGVAASVVAAASLNQNK
ncbi:PREDICTED: late embryogenesis abundant protein D-34 [Nelumbo nucifera]|uniref:Late embryogenesis abundant protein D-34 n=2 Tax=Nelumbo nucifera TaxID=4432 RepID=A0A1U7ZRG9_NELNU|nr:PREDICTED: late embryogenesis abundant protein D-34 [Nelumbo nucifera]DAD19565.1 TPA_asm: hypothetical protein HUJ06_021028 [Nelumbo nucifera]